MTNRSTSPPRASHAQSWFTLGLYGLLFVYFIMVWFLEGIHLRAWLTQVLLLPPTQLIWEFFTLFVVILRHFLPIAVGWWFAYSAAVGMMQRLYDLPTRDDAALFLSRLRSPDYTGEKGAPVMPHTLEIERPNSVLLRVGGPGKVRVEPFMAAVTEDNGRFARILSAGSFQLHPFEYVHTVLDLRPQERIVADAVVRTRDNIDLTVTFSIVYRIRLGDEQPSKTKPYPYDEAAVKAAAYAQTVLENGTASTWEAKPAGTTRSKLAAAVERYRLDEIMHPPGRTDEPYRTLQREVWRTARTELANSGIDLLSVHIDRMQPPPDVEDQYIAYWRTHWQEKARLSKADGEATAKEEIEIARAEAEVAMIQAILEGIQRARRSGATTRTSEIVALRLIEALERMAEQSRQKPDAQTLLAELDELRSEMVTRAMSGNFILPGNPEEGSSP
ncbi:MAG TPA: SPFH domain-containing protein [Chloroflexota bacterium]|nr:SPFH domain-containing protein [Chloroflexota bacterium]